MADDRDHRRIKTPAKGVLAQLARAESEADKFDEESTPPVPEAPLDEIRRRQKRTDKKLDHIALKMEGFANREERHDREHEDFRRAHEQASGQITLIKEDVVELKLVTTRVDTTLVMLLDEVRSQRRISEVHQKVTIETDAKRTTLSLEDSADAKKTRRGLIAKVLGSVIGGGSAVAALILGVQAC